MKPKVTHCKYGHPYTEGNVKIYRHSESREGKQAYTYQACKTCSLERAAAYYKKHRKAILEFAKESRRELSGNRKMGIPRPTRRKNAKAQRSA